MNKRQYFSHVTPEGKKLLDRLKDSGYFASPCASCRWKAAYAEDIAYGSQSMDQLIQSWMKSKEDRANILNPAFVDIGVGMNGFFLVQDFGAITVTNPPPLSSSALAALKQRVIDLVNSERAKAKLPALQAEPHLDKAAQSQAADLTKRNYFNHISPEGTTPSDRIKAAGYAPIPPCNGCSFNTYYGENIAKNQETAQEVMTAWMNSPGHRANILNPKFQDIGIGIDGPSWVQEFGGVDVSKNGAAKP